MADTQALAALLALLARVEGGENHRQTGPRVTADAPTPARALLAALIKAKMEESAQ